MQSNKKVVIALSGGVDSSVAALLLKNQGHQVIGVTGLMFDGAHDIAKNAKEISDIIGIEHHVLDLRQQFGECIINYFEKSYKQGLTPNPCVACNKLIKWNEITTYAFDTLGADLYATGHYSNIVKEGEYYKIQKAADAKKDQMYMLYNLSQEDLRKTIFPLAGMTKDEVKKIAMEASLPCYKSKESQDVCFVPDNTKKYLLRTFGEKEGEIVDINTNKVLGKHNGSYLYTIGQRKGIGIAAPRPLYVIKTDANTNTVYVGYAENLYKKTFEVNQVNWQLPQYSSQEFECLVKIRYNSSAKNATVKPLPNNKAIIEFSQDQSAISPGQSAVFYDSANEFLIGGGTII